MPRANRFFLPGQIWHITHRCHRKSFLLRFARDRRGYLSWLLEPVSYTGTCATEARWDAVRGGEPEAICRYCEGSRQRDAPRSPRPFGLRPGRSSTALPSLTISAYGLRRAPCIRSVLATTHHAPVYEMGSEHIREHRSTDSRLRACFPGRRARTGRLSGEARAPGDPLSARWRERHYWTHRRRE